MKLSLTLFWVVILLWGCGEDDPTNNSANTEDSTTSAQGTDEAGSTNDSDTSGSIDRGTESSEFDTNDTASETDDGHAGNKSVCGNGELEPGELCDDGGTEDSDGCSGNCLNQNPDFDCSVPGEDCVNVVICGNGTLEGDELCDEGAANKTAGCSPECDGVTEGWSCPRPGRACVEIPVCGNSVRERGEQCDDGNSVSGDGCTDTCGQEDGYYCVPGAACVRLICGDDNKTPNEACDDGNTANGDGCSGKCTVEAGYRCSANGCNSVCGDGLIVSYEQCDDGNRDSGDGCSVQCIEEPFFVCDGAEPTTCTTTVVCGNGELEPGEVCDPGIGGHGLCYPSGTNACMGYENDLVVEAVCGNGIIEFEEACDGDNGSGCSDTCELENGYICPKPNFCTRVNVCGDGQTRYDQGEQCDDGNQVNGDGCTAGCSAIEDGYDCPETGGPCALIPSECGDGNLDWDEVCDDYNTNSGDGCSSNCTVELGYACPYQGAPCIPDCGDGIQVASEACDDGNDDNTDGCTNQCKWEEGKTCKYIKPAGSSTYECIVHQCGDGELGALWRTTIACDDANKEVGDGCSPLCKKEPDCTPGGGCTSECGDGIVIAPETCDDGNNRNGDGCADNCTVEPGYVCDISSVLGDSMDVLAIYKDFEQGDLGGDFQNTSLQNCNIKSPGMVEAQLSDSNGKPVFDAAYGNPTVSGTYNGSSHTNPDDCDKVSNGSNFALWYDHMTSNQKAIVVKPLTLWKNADGDYVNQWLEDGTRWYKLQGNYEQWCSGDVASSAAECDTMCAASISNYDPNSGDWECQFPCTNWGNQTCAVFSGGDRIEYDGNPVFFPIDGMGIDTDVYAALVPEPVYAGGWGDEESYVLNNGMTPSAGYSYNHNFLFTSEIRFWFEYDSSASQTLNFVGDDDVWVFVNGIIALDMGGIHIPIEDEFTLQSLESSHGLEDGKVYEIVVFQAERQRDGSSYKLTLGGFNSDSSVCVPKCGDGVVTVGEQCDNGVENSDTSYNGCTSTCELGPRCGDGIVQGQEECDNTVNTDTYGILAGDTCGANCQLPEFCGDGVLQAQHGEQCDDGIENNGAYGACNSDCTLGPYCGDGVVAATEEECDPVDGVFVTYGAQGGCGYDCMMVPYCGDGIRNGPEQCDGTANCTADCEYTPYCGDGLTASTEECDYGTFGFDSSGVGVYGSCSDTCELGPFCGDGEVFDAMEECDDGGANDDGAYDGCTSGCTLGPRCGDGVVQASEGEACDNGYNEDTYAYVNDACGENCSAVSYCGDGAVQRNFELCDNGADNGNNVYDGCTTECDWGPYCGDGEVQAPHETCDLGMDNASYSMDGEGCGYDCQPAPYCGDGTRNGSTEECDDGTVNNTGVYGGCFGDCTKAPHCGDLIVQAENGEHCDDGPIGSLDCGVNCRFRTVAE